MARWVRISGEIGASRTNGTEAQEEFEDGVLEEAEAEEAEEQRQVMGLSIPTAFRTWTAPS